MVLAPGFLSSGSCAGYSESGSGSGTLIGTVNISNRSYAVSMHLIKEEMDGIEGRFGEKKGR